MGREKWIDNAKGIAIILVIIGHVSYGMEGAFNWDFVHGFHLIIFFLLSGYTLKNVPLSKEWIGKKFSRLMVPYFITCFAIMIMDIVNLGSFDRAGSIGSVTLSINTDLVRSFFASGWYQEFAGIELNGVIGAIWFFPALFFALLIVLLFLNKTENSLYLGLFTGGCALMGIITARFIWLPFSVQSGMMASFFVWIGYEIKRRDILQKLKRHHFVISFLVLIVGSIMGFSAVWISTANMKDWVLSFIVGMSGFLVIYWISIHVRKTNVLSYFGKISLYILCVHEFAIYTLDRYFDVLLDHWGLVGNPRVWIRILLNVIFAVAVAAIIETVKRNVSGKVFNSKSFSHERGIEGIVYICFGISILLLLTGHFPIAESLGKTIYSFHIAALILLNGYLFASQKERGQYLKKIFFYQLIPYLLFVLAELLKTFKSQGFMEPPHMDALIRDWLHGPARVLLIVIIVGVIYCLLDRLLSEHIFTRMGLIIILSVCGYLLSRNGIQLPFGFDIALYSMVFFEVGVWIFKYDLISKIKNNSVIYFLASPVWVYMIYAGSMDLEIGDLGSYGIGIIGAVAGVITVLLLAGYISDRIPCLRRFLAFSGKCWVIVLLVHSLIAEKLNNTLPRFLDNQGMPFLTVSVAVQVFIALIISFVCIKVRDTRLPKVHPL